MEVGSAEMIWPRSTRPTKLRWRLGANYLREHGPERARKALTRENPCRAARMSIDTRKLIEKFYAEQLPIQAVA